MKSGLGRMSSTTARLLPFVFAALIAGACSASAEDAIKDGEHLGDRRAEPCAAFGPGYVRLPGSETCIRIGGDVRLDVGGGDIGRTERRSDD
jgi:hypothetical protein